MSPHEPPRGFVDNFMKLLNDYDINEFQKVLDMKVCVGLFIKMDDIKLIPLGPEMCVG